MLLTLLRHTLLLGGASHGDGVGKGVEFFVDVSMFVLVVKVVVDGDGSGSRIVVVDVVVVERVWKEEGKT